MTHTFVVNTNALNEYKYRVITEGIDYEQYLKNPVVLYWHERNFADAELKGSEVIGRCVKLFKEGEKLIAEIEFDEADPFAKKIAGKVERGYIRMASIYADPLETSTDPKDLLPGQVFETVTKCKLVEITIVDIGGNDDALKLRKSDAAIKLNKIQQKSESMSFKTIALALGLNPDASEDVILNEVTKIKLAKDTAEANELKLKTEVETNQTADATALVEKAVKLNLIPEALKSAQMSAFKADFAGQKVTLSKLIEDKETEDGKTNKVKLVKDVLGGNKKVVTGNSGEYQKGDFVKLSKENSKELIRLRNEEPEEFKALYKAEYGVEPTNV